MAAGKAFLPREGLHIGPIATWFKFVFLNPIFNICFLIGLLWPHFSKIDEFQPATAKILFNFPIFLTFTVTSILIHTNTFLSRWAKNNFTYDPSLTQRWSSSELVLVTGAASASEIGSSVVQNLSSLKPDAKIVVLDIAPLAYKAGPNVQYYQCDLSSSSEIAAIMEIIRKEHGNPTVLINNAGIFRGAKVANGNSKDTELVIRSNLLAPFLMIQECLPNTIEKNHGHIIMLASMSAFVSPGGLANYASTKAGCVAMHDALSVELAQCAPAIRLSLIIPGFVRTPMTKDFECFLEGNASSMIPFLHVDTVGDAIVDTLLSGYGRDVFLPGIMRYVAGIRGWPLWIQCFIRKDGTPKALLECSPVRSPEDEDPRGDIKSPDQTRR